MNILVPRGFVDFLHMSSSFLKFVFERIQLSLVMQVKPCSEFFFICMTYCLECWTMSPGTVLWSYGCIEKDTDPGDRENGFKSQFSFLFVTYNSFICKVEKKLKVVLKILLSRIPCFKHIISLKLVTVSSFVPLVLCPLLTLISSMTLDVSLNLFRLVHQ